MIDEKKLIALIKDHKATVRCDGVWANEIYGMAHDHIIDLVVMLAEREGKG